MPPFLETSVTPRGPRAQAYPVRETEIGIPISWETTRINRTTHANKSDHRLSFHNRLVTLSAYRPVEYYHDFFPLASF